MILTARERKALNAADYPDGVRRGDSGFMGIGEPTLQALIDRGLLESFPQAVAGYPLYRTTAAGKAALREPTPVKPSRPSPRVKMLQPRLSTLDTRTAKPPRR